MNIQKSILIVFLFAFSTVCFGERVDSVKIDTLSSNLTCSYNSSLIYPGARIGIEFPIIKNDITKFKKSEKKKDFVKDYFITANLSFYHQPNFQDNVYLTGGWTMRKTRTSGFFTEFSPEIGLSRTFLGATTYRVDNNGNVSIEKFAGYYYALMSVGEGVGYDFSITKSKPLKVFFKLNMLCMFPYNSTIYMRPAAEIGLIYTPSNFLLIRVKEKSISK